MPIITKLDKLKINYLTQAQYDAAVANDAINENELYFTPDTGSNSSGGGGSTYTPIIRINNIDYVIQRWEYATVSGKTGINFVYLDGVNEDTLFIPITPPTLSMSIDSVDTKKLNISYI